MAASERPKRARVCTLGPCGRTSSWRRCPCWACPRQLPAAARATLRPFLVGRVSYTFGLQVGRTGSSVLPVVSAAHAGAPCHGRLSGPRVLVGPMRWTAKLQVPCSAVAEPAVARLFTHAHRPDNRWRVQGPCLSTDTACSSSLVALHLACDGVRGGQGRGGLAAGVNAMLSVRTTMKICQLQVAPCVRLSSSHAQCGRRQSTASASTSLLVPCTSHSLLLCQP